MMDVIYVADVVRRLVDEKRKSSLVPSDVTMSEVSSVVHKELKTALNSLVKSGVLVFKRQLNDISFNLKENGNGKV